MKNITDTKKALLYLLTSLLLTVLCLAGANWIDKIMMLAYNLK